ncbi:hypothetical protein ACI3LY_000084 [Candidozyma auris]|uniref:Nucleoporin Nup159/Nup146 N-terminal domain-containing protein n=2 Tax=Candidozyma auris TaxID=498019 RepID=A0A2H1A7A0_CANAR|nr:hypothetical protein QG37_02979 [[Candida] auris]PIS58472.1 hypothetical protein B9J08_000971 [[Candida] auris]QWW23706.1 hypothetical protein CA7LBN_002507 [[Candida] auris]
MSELPETFSETFGFHLDGHKDGIKLFDDPVDLGNESLAKSPLQLLAVGNIKKIYVASNGAKVVIGRVETLGEDRRYFDMPNTTTVALSADNETIYIVADNSLKRASTEDILLGKHDFKKVASDVTSFRASPTVTSLHASLSNQGSLMIYHDDSQCHTIGSVSGFAWNTDGISIATVYGGEFKVQKYDGTELATYSDDSATFNQVAPVFEDRWLLVSTPEGEDPVYTLLEKKGSEFTSYEVPLAPPFGEAERAPSLYISYLQNWIKDKTLTLVTSALSTEISTIFANASNTELVSHANDTDRAELPMDDASGEDTLPVGFAVDITGTMRVVKEPCQGVEEANGVLPRLFCLNNAGNLIVWDVFESAEINKENLSLERALPQLTEVDKSTSSQEKASVLVSNDKSSDFSGPFSSAIPKHEPKSEAETQKPSAPPASPFKSGFGTIGLGSSSSTTPSSSGFGQLGFSASGTSKAAGDSGFGKSGFGQSGFGSSGFGQSGFGQSGFGQSGFGQSGFGSKTATQSSGADVKSGFGSYASKGNAFAYSTSSPFGNASSGNDIFGSKNDEQSQKDSIFGESSKGILGETSETKSTFGQSFGAKPFGSSSEGKSIFGQPTDSKLEDESSKSKTIFGGVSDMKPFGKSGDPYSSFGNLASNLGEGLPTLGQSSEKPSPESPLKQSTSSKPFGTKEQSSKDFVSNAKSSLEAASGFGNLSLGEKDTGSSLFGKRPSTTSEKKSSIFGVISNETSPFGEPMQSEKNYTKTPSTEAKEDLAKLDVSNDSTPDKLLDESEDKDLKSNSISPESEEEALDSSTKSTRPVDQVDVSSPSGQEVPAPSANETSEEKGKHLNSDPMLGSEEQNNDKIPSLPSQKPNSIPSDEKSSSVRRVEQSLQRKNGSETEATDFADEETSDKEVSASPLIDAPPSLVDFEMLVLSGLEKSENSGTKVEQEMRTILQTTDAMIKVLITNSHHIASRIRALEYDKDENDYKRLGTTNAVAKKAMELRSMGEKALSSATDLNRKIDDIMEIAEASEKWLFRCERALSSLSKYERSIKSKELKERPLEIKAEIMRRKLRQKMAEVERQYDEAMRAIMPLQIRKKIDNGLVDKLEQVVYEINTKIKMYSKDISKIEEDIASLSEQRLIKDTPEVDTSLPLTFSDTKWKWARELHNPQVYRSEL